jgi:serine/threonine protein phosphatase PrpC
MSRSIGDFDASNLGVISTPVTTAVQHTPGADFFIVAGSDGIWDVMENEEVANFVEKYRSNCLKETSGPGRVKRYMPSNACIAQLLCEEARQRWITIVEEEDVMIDDISAVVWELHIEDTVEHEHIKPIEIARDDHEESPAVVDQQNKRFGKDMRRASIIG